MRIAEPRVIRSLNANGAGLQPACSAQCVWKSYIQVWLRTEQTRTPPLTGGRAEKLLPLPLNAEGALFYGRSPLSSEVVTSFLVISENCRQFISNINLLLLLFFPSPEKKKNREGERLKQNILGKESRKGRASCLSLPPRSSLSPSAPELSKTTR